MKTLICALGLALGLLSPVAAVSGPLCPPKDMLAQLPGTQNVTVGQASVSTAEFPGMWQQGGLKTSGLQYRLFVNASGSIGEDDRMRSWRVDFECDLAGHSCKYTPYGGAPKAAMDAAKAIGGCLIHQFPKSLAHPISKPAVRAVPSLAHPISTPRPKKMAEAQPLAAKTTASISPATDTAAAVTPTSTPIASKAAAALAGAKTQGAPALDPGGVAAKHSSFVMPLQSRTDAQKPTAAAAQPAPQSAAQSAAKPIAQPTAQPSVQPSVQLAAQPVSQPAPQANGAAMCWVDGIPAESPPARTQRLLLLMGLDAGPVDGRFGSRTYVALAQALGRRPDVSDLAVTNARLRGILCQDKSGQSRP